MVFLLVCLVVLDRAAWDFDKEEVPQSDVRYGWMVSPKKKKAMSYCCCIVPGAVLLFPGTCSRTLAPPPPNPQRKIHLEASTRSR